MSGNVQGASGAITTPERFDAMTAPAIESALQGLITSGAKWVVCDLAATEYVSSAALRVLLAAAKGLRAAGGELVLSAPRPYVREILETAGLDKIMRVFASAEAARAAFEA